MSSVVISMVQVFVSQGSLESHPEVSVNID